MKDDFGKVTPKAVQILAQIDAEARTQAKSSHRRVSRDLSRPPPQGPTGSAVTVPAPHPKILTDLSREAALRLDPSLDPIAWGRPKSMTRENFISLAAMTTDDISSPHMSLKAR
jgi:hypothetical protein